MSKKAPSNEDFALDLRQRLKRRAKKAIMLLDGALNGKRRLSIAELHTVKMILDAAGVFDPAISRQQEQGPMVVKIRYVTPGLKEIGEQ